METVLGHWISERMLGQGCPRAPMIREDRHLPITARRNKDATASQLSRELYAATGIVSFMGDCFQGAVGPDFILMDDNVRPHRDHLVDEFLENANICQMDWSTRFADLNLIEPARDAPRRAIATCNPPPRAL
ncbi:HTH_Tnp_Tc3_2 domain-containing protein [Trichonephila clavipes]|uniref:HTH_Tnp_Tc3_2 domain-containing protein n=1 Tax=Trichonephila clavipes TaxID=2585209 RepID=A0A8X6RBC1_TRICX|nr:HTH_Tnp_Tc3_2 domain-containing protein [Trichonephila clavipes]